MVAPGNPQPQGRAAQASANLAKIADETIKAAAEVADDASNKIDVGAYGVGQLVRSMVRLASVTTRGGLRMAESVLDDRPRRPTDGMLMLADHMASIAERTIKNVKGVVDELTPRIADSPLNTTAWANAATKLTDIAVVSAIEVAETAIIGPASYASTEFISDSFSMPGDEVTGALSIIEDFRRPGTDVLIERVRIRFDPPAIKSDNRAFRVVVNETSLPSGVYIGVVGIVPKNGAKGAQTSVAIRL